MTTDAKQFYWDDLVPGKVSGELSDPAQVRWVHELHTMGWVVAAFRTLKGLDTYGQERAVVKTLLKKSRD